jgi:hypothetical protein
MLTVTCDIPAVMLTVTCDIPAVMSVSVCCGISFP